MAAPQQASYLVETSPIPPRSAVLAHVTPVNLSQQQPAQMHSTPSQPSPLEGVSAEAPDASTPLPPLLSFLETTDPTSANWRLSAQQTVAAADAPSPGPQASDAIASGHAILPNLTASQLFCADCCLQEADAPVPAIDMLVSYFEVGVMPHRSRNASALSSAVASSFLLSDVWWRGRRVHAWARLR